MLEVFDVSLGHQTSWTGCPYSSLHCRYSSLHCQKTWIWPGWPDGLERNCLWAVSPLFPLDGLERRSHRDIWASSELCSFCRLCCWGPDSCRIVHISVSVTVPVIHLMGPVPCLLGKNWTCSLTLRGCRSLALWALSNCSFCLSWSLTSLCRIWHIDPLGWSWKDCALSWATM